jgi:hypothetical protein
LTIMIGWPSAKRIWACCVCLGKNRRRDVIKHEITCRGQFHSTSTSFLILSHPSSRSQTTSPFLVRPSPFPRTSTALFNLCRSSQLLIIRPSYPHSSPPYSIIR